MTKPPTAKELLKQWMVNRVPDAIDRAVLSRLVASYVVESIRADRAKRQKTPTSGRFGISEMLRELLGDTEIDGYR